LAEDTAFHYQIKTKSQQIIKHIIHNYTFWYFDQINSHKVIRALLMI
jgi:hypothetical protein